MIVHKFLFIYTNKPSNNGDACKQRIGHGLSDLYRIIL